MELRRINITDSLYSPERLRLIGEVHYENPEYRPEYYWFDVAGKYHKFLNRSANPWLVCLLPLAVTLGESLRLCAPVDPVLFSNAHELMRIWKRWYPHLSVVGIDAQLDHQRSDEEMSGSGASLFSAGVDSFFTVLRHTFDADLVGRKNIDDLLFVWGFNIPLSLPEEFSRMSMVLENVSSDLGKNFVPIYSNLAQTRWVKTSWPELSHACFLLGAGLTLESKYHHILIPSTYPYENLRPYGSHPLTDPLLSTNHCRIFHDGAAFSRIEKTEYVSRSRVALRTLQVCWDSNSEKNCQQCSKCYRTMTTLFLLDKLKECATLREDNFSLSKLRRIYLPDRTHEELMQEVRNYALVRGRKDIARAISWSSKRSRVVRALMGKIHFPKKLERLAYGKTTLRGAFMRKLKKLIRPKHIFSAGSCRFLLP